MGKTSEVEIQRDALESALEEAHKEIETLKAVQQERDSLKAQLEQKEIVQANYEEALGELRKVTAERDEARAADIYQVFVAMEKLADKAEDQAKRYREALVWYATDTNYDYVGQCAPPVNNDEGNRARQALREPPSDQPKAAEKIVACTSCGDTVAPGWFCPQCKRDEEKTNA